VEKAKQAANQYFKNNTTNTYEMIELQLIGKNRFIGIEDCACNELYNTSVECIS